MRVLLGPPGSGKTARILEEVERAGASADVRLVTPTATMADHLRHELARRGAAVRPSAIVTLSALVETAAPGLRAAGASDLAVLIEEILARAGRRLFGPLEGSPGLAAALASAIEDLSNAGCDSLTWRSLKSLGVHSDAALTGLYEDLEERLRRQGLLLRATQLGLAARRIRESGIRLRQVWLDGFFAFSRAELELIRALGEKTAVTVSLPEWEGCAPALKELRSMGASIVSLPPARPSPRHELILASSREREADEIALRMIEEHSGGRPWRDMGIIVRRAQPYVPLLERTLARAGIPCRAYFGHPLATHPVGVLLADLVQAAVSGWEGEKTLRVLRHAVAASRPAAGLDQAAGRVREALPFAGLERMRALAGPAADVLLPLQQWPAEELPPSEWARRLRVLNELVAPPPAGRALAQEELMDWRGRAAALEAAARALERAAALLAPEPVSLERFWHYGAQAVAAASVRVTDRRRDVVHLIDALEARQWELPVVFVCGLIEGEFPAAAQPDPVLPDETRWRLAQQGIPVRTRAGREREERFLFEIVRTRATVRLSFSWPAFDDEGRATLRAFVLDELEIKPEPQQARRLSIAPRFEAPRSADSALQAPDVLAALQRKHRAVRATSIESFLQCPFQFFAASTMELEQWPGLPHQRLDRRFLGTVLHQVLAEWHRRGGAIQTLFEEVWERELRSARIPPSHRIEIERLWMLRGLLAYEQDARIRSGWRIETEKPLELRLNNGSVKGRADRVDISPQGEFIVCDFKYSNRSSVMRRVGKQNQGLIVQGGLYAAALEAQGLQPAGLYLVGVKQETTWNGSEEPGDVRARAAQAVDAAAGALEKIAGGQISVEPADPEMCQYCSFSDACRIGEARAKAWAATGSPG